MTDESTIYLFFLVLLSMFFQSNQVNASASSSNSSTTTANPLITSETGTKSKASDFFYIQMERLILQIFFSQPQPLNLMPNILTEMKQCSLKRIDQVIIIQ